MRRPVFPTQRRKTGAAAPSVGTAPPVFRRDGVTATGYAALTAYAYCLYGLAPFLTLLRRDLHFSYLVMSMHSTVFAAGSILAGAAFPQGLRLLGRHRLFQWCLLGTVCGALLLAMGDMIAVTLTAAALLGLAGPLLQTSSLALLSAHHPGHRDRALVEGNAAASAAAVLAPALIGSLGGTGIGWRSGLALPVATLVLLYLLSHRRPLPDYRPIGAATAVSREPLPTTFWIRCAVVGAVAGVEFGMVFYGSPLLVTRLGLGISQATTMMTLFAAGILAGRLAGSRLVRAQGRAPRMLAGSLLATGIGVAVFWTSGQPVLSGAALLVAGAGVANLFPLALSHAIAAVPERSDTAAARIQLVVSAAIMVAPLTLGALSDALGVVPAFATEAVLVAGALLLVASSHLPDAPRSPRSARERRTGPSAP